MEVRNCRNCRRLFNYVGGQQICPECKEKLEKLFYQVKEYIRENPHARLQEISDDNGVSQQQLQQWVREERLQFSSDSDIAISCEKCGTKIFTGRFCDACKMKMANGLSDAFKKEPPKEVKKEDHSNRMRFMKK